MAAAPQQLKLAADELVGSLHKGEAVLDQVAHRLEDEFARRCRPGEVNPLALAQRVRRLASEIPDLQRACQGMIKAKQDLVDAARQQLHANHARIEQLRAASGAAARDAQAEAAHDGFQGALAEWDAQMRQQAPSAMGLAGVGGSEAHRHHHLTRDELNAALAGLALGRM